MRIVNLDYIRKLNSFNLDQFFYSQKQKQYFQTAIQD